MHSDYDIAGFRLNAFYDHNSLNSKFPEFLAGQSESVQDSTGDDVGFGAQHDLPLHGQFYANFNRASAESHFFSDSGQSSNMSSYTDDIVNTGASFHPTQKLSLNVTENYTSNLNGYLSQKPGQRRGSAAGTQPGIGCALLDHAAEASRYQFTGLSCRRPRRPHTTTRTISERTIPAHT